MLSLSQRIVTMPIKIPNYILDEGVPRLRNLRPENQLNSGDVTVIDVTNVVDYHKSHHVPINISKLPKVVVPFNRWFVEWTNRSSVDGTWTQGGMLGETFDAKSDAVWSRHEEGFKEKLLSFGRPLTEELRFVQMFTHFVACNKGPDAGQPVMTGLVGTLGCDVEGRYIESVVGSFGESMSTEAHEFANELTKEQTLILGVAASFMNCSNVKLQEIGPEHYSIPGERRNGPPIKRITRKILEIEPMKEVLRKDGAVESNGIQKAMHICRGHFSTYTEDKKLFGKHAGTFWVPQHVRGSQEVGYVQKAYNVLAPKDETK